MNIHPINTRNRGEVRRFVQFPNHLYRHCSQWIPYPPSDGLAQLNRNNAYFEHSEADFFVAEDNGQLLGRICVMENRHYNQYHQAKHAFFYLFDAVDDAEVAHGLFETATEWGRVRGLKMLVGPKGFVPFDGMGMLYKGFEHRPAMGVPYNFAYYNQFMTNLGFEKEIDFTSFYLNSRQFNMPDRIRRAAEWVQKRRHLRIKTFSSNREVRRWIPTLVDTYNQVFINNWEYVPVTPAETEELTGRMLQIAKPEQIKLILDKDDRVVGFLLTFLDIGEALRQTGGRLLPFGWVKLLRGLRQTRRVNINGMGILEEYRGLGGNAILYAELEKTLRQGDFEHADIVQMADTVEYMLADMTTVGVVPYKVHRVYRRNI
jgi:hypothetical protein